MMTSEIMGDLEKLNAKSKHCLKLVENEWDREKEKMGLSKKDEVIALTLMASLLIVIKKTDEFLSLSPSDFEEREEQINAFVVVNLKEITAIFG